jgi:hypothetical protein
MRRSALLLFAVLLLPALRGIAEARDPADVFGGTIRLSKQSFPAAAKSQEQFISQIQTQSTDKFWEDKDKRRWIIHYAAFFKAPINDLELQVKIYDVSQNPRRLMESYEQYLMKRGQRGVTGELFLTKAKKKGDGKYEPNSKIQIILESRGKIVASATAFLQGEGFKYSGKVSFDEEDANSNKDLDEDEDE